MTVERSMYKLLIVGLGMVALALALSMASQIKAVSSSVLGGYSPIAQVITILAVSGRFLIALVALYWVPKAVKKLIPEVS